MNIFVITLLSFITLNSFAVAISQDKPGECPAFRGDIVTICVAYCENDGDCEGEEKCCTIGCTRKCMKPVKKAFFADKPCGCPDFTVIVPEPHFCKMDSDCERGEKCCFNRGRWICAKPIVTDKPGICPRFHDFPQVLRPHFCENDCDCEGEEKCCHNGHGRWKICKKPIVTDKPCGCPNSPVIVPKPHFCKKDSDCKRGEICCFNRGGWICGKPIITDKPGTCPRFHGFTPVFKPHFCENDCDCEGEEKCCVIILGWKICTRQIGIIDKTGICPIFREPHYDVVGPDSKFCEEDSDCEGEEICCHIHDRKICTEPIGIGRG